MREEGCWQGQQLVNCIGPPPTSERIARPAPPPADEEGIARRLCQNVRHALKSSEAFANVFDKCTLYLILRSYSIIEFVLVLVPYKSCSILFDDHRIDRSPDVDC